MAVKAKRLLGLQDHDTHMAIIQSMQAELKRINARRLWDYAARCVLSELGARMPHHLFRQRVLKNRRVRTHSPLTPLSILLMPFLDGLLQQERSF